MAWKPSGQPHVRSQRDKWVVRIDGIDTETGKGRPRQLGTYTSKRAATKAASEFAAQRDTGGDRRTVGAFVTKWAAGRVDVAENTREQHVWAAGHTAAGIGAIRVDRLQREDVAQWLDGLASAGIKSRRSIQIFRMVLRAALDEAVDRIEHHIERSFGAELSFDWTRKVQIAGAAGGYPGDRARSGAGRLYVCAGRLRPARPARSSCRLLEYPRGITGITGLYAAARRRRLRSARSARPTSFGDARGVSRPC